MRAHIVTVLAAVGIGSLTLAIGVGLVPCEAIAQSQFFNLDGIVDPQEERVVRRYLNGSDPFWQVGPNGAVSPEEAEQTRRRTLGRAMPKAVPRVGGFLLRSGVYSVAGGVVWHDMKMMWDLGQGNPLASLAVNADFFPADGGGAVRAGFNDDGTTGYITQLSSIDVAYGQSNARIDFEMMQSAQNIYCAYTTSDCFIAGAGFRAYYTDGTNSGLGAFGFYDPTDTSRANAERQQQRSHSNYYVEYKAVTVERIEWCDFYRAGYRSDRCAVVWPKEGQPQEGTTFYAPYEVGPSTANPEITPNDEGAFISTPQETEYLAHEIRDHPEYDPDAERDGAIVYAPGAGNGDQTDPGTGGGTDYGPAEFTRENTDGSTTTRYQDGTEVTTWPDGWNYTRPAEGTGTWTQPSGEPLTEGQSPPYQPPAGGYGGPTDQGGNSCRQAPSAVPFIPPLDFERKFPFSLVVWVWEAVSDLGGGGSGGAPVIHLGGFIDADIDLARFGPVFGVIRSVSLWLGGLMIVLFFYMQIKGGKGSE